MNFIYSYFGHLLNLLDSWNARSGLVFNNWIQSLHVCGAYFFAKNFLFIDCWTFIFYWSFLDSLTGVVCDSSADVDLIQPLTKLWPGHVSLYSDFELFSWKFPFFHYYHLTKEIFALNFISLLLSCLHFLSFGWLRQEEVLETKPVLLSILHEYFYHFLSTHQLAALFKLLKLLTSPSLQNFPRPFTAFKQGLVQFQHFHSPLEQDPDNLSQHYGISDQPQLFCLQWGSSSIISHSFHWPQR